MIDLAPAFQPLLNALWYLIPLVVVVHLIKSPWFKGKVGEFLVNLSARLFLDKSRYHLIKNVTLPTEDGTTQIDHVLVSEFGVFVVETKNMKGWIFGSPHQRFWTQKIFRSSHKFQNPMHQNYKHVKTLQALLGLGDHQLHSVVVFVGDSTFKTSMPDNVTQGFGYVRYIKSKQERVLSPQEVIEVCNKVSSGRLKPSFATDHAHARYVSGLVAERHSDARSSGPSGFPFKVLLFPVFLIGAGAIMLNAYSNFASKAMELNVLKKSPLQPASAPAPEVAPPVAQPQANTRTVSSETTPRIERHRTNQPPSELFLARQECNSLIAAALGNQDARLLRDRDKACARYKSLRGDM